MLKRTITVVTLLLGLGSLNNAQAALWCSGVVSRLGWDTSGKLFAQYGAGWHPYCSVNGDVTVTTDDSGGQRTITVEMCEKLYAMFLTSRSTGRSMTFAYNTSSVSDCNSLGTWAGRRSIPIGSNWIEGDLKWSG